MKVLELTGTVRKALDAVILAILGTIIVSMVVLVLWQIISRSILNSPSVITEELVRFSLIWLGLLGASYGISKKQHVSITLLVDKVPQKFKLGLTIFTFIVIIFFSTFILIGGGTKLMSVAMMQLSSTLRVPMGYVYTILPVSGVLNLVFTLFDIIEMIKERGGAK